MQICYSYFSIVISWQVDDGYKIELTFTDFDLEDEANCGYDYVEGNRWKIVLKITVLFIPYISPQLGWIPTQKVVWLEAAWQRDHLREWDYCQVQDWQHHHRHGLGCHLDEADRCWGQVERFSGKLQEWQLSQLYKESTKIRITLIVS